jgi:nitrogen regulatory protein P-II 1
MKLLVFVLNKEEMLEKAMEAYVEAGIPGATILDSEGMGRYLAYEVPLFADFKDFMKGNAPGNKTILSLLRDEAALERLLPILKDTIPDFTAPGTGVMFTVPVDWEAGIGRIDDQQRGDAP